MQLGFNTRFLSFTAVLLFVAAGTYNTVVINSESSISGDMKFVKRLDEIYGVTVQGREVAATVTWQKLAPAKKLAKNKQQEIIQTVKVASAAPEAPVESASPSEAAVQEDLTLSLTEVINQRKWASGLSNTQYSGSLVANNGVIEELSVALPDGEGLSVSFSEMTGNVFEYDMNGELYSGMMYQVDQHAYMVTLTNGPLEGTRLRFSNVAAQQEAQQLMVENNNVEVGNFGNNSDQYGNNGDQYGYAYDPNPQVLVQAQEVAPQEIVQNDQQMQKEAMQAQAMRNEENQAL